MHEHSGSVHDVLEMLERGLTASSIMTSWPFVEFVEGDGNSPDTKTACKILMDTKQYSGVPLLSRRKMIGMYVRHDPNRSPCYEGTRREHAVKPEMGLLDLIRRMRDTKKIVVAVGTLESPVGWLTYADFSKRPFRVLLFAIVAEVEYLLARAIDECFPDDSWLGLLPKLGDHDHQAELARRQREAKSWDVTMPLTTFAEIWHLIQVVNSSQPVRDRLGADPNLCQQLKSLPDIRNRVAHVVKPVVAGPAEIASVANQIDLLLGWITDWSARLSTTLRAPEAL